MARFLQMSMRPKWQAMQIAACRMFFNASSIAIVLQAKPLVKSHGRILEPPGRSSAWRTGYSAPINYDDDQLYCGGFTRQHNVNEGRCGICGDAWDTPTPRENEDGGLYGTRRVYRTYSKDETVGVTIEITAHHKGYFEFRLAPAWSNNGTTQAELDKHLLYIEESKSTRYTLPPGSGNGLYEFRVRLPTNVTCERCVMQWHWWTGNRWDICPDGRGQLGCGPQETFRGCSDIAIR